MDTKHKIPLRQFYKNIDEYIINQASDIAISYSKYLLEKYPKNITVYQLLGKAYLDRQNFDTALSFFEKILEIEPDDFVSHIGISLISENFGNLNRALISMKRAYELQPSNESLQKEVQRLFKAKDGFAPEKIRLTRGALIKMYTRSKLTEQAIAEARLGIHESPDRIDYKVHLADMLLVANKSTEAIEHCVEIIHTYPFCKPVLEILYRAFSESGSNVDANTYMSRLTELDPYYIFMKPDTKSVNDIPDIAIMIEECDIPESKINDIKEFLLQTWVVKDGEQTEIGKVQENDWKSIVDEATANNGIGASIINTDFEEVKPEAIDGVPVIEDPIDVANISKRDKFVNKLTSKTPKSDRSENEIPDWILADDAEKDIHFPENVLPACQEESPMPDRSTNFEEDGMTDHLVPVNPEIINGDFMADAGEWKKHNQKESTNEILTQIPLDDTQKIKIVKKNPDEIIRQLKIALEENDIEFSILCINSLVSRKYKPEEIALQIKEYLSGQPKEIELWLILVRIYRGLNDNDNALAALENAQLNISL